MSNDNDVNYDYIADTDKWSEDSIKELEAIKDRALNSRQKLIDNIEDLMEKITRAKDKSFDIWSERINELQDIIDEHEDEVVRLQRDSVDLVMANKDSWQKKEN